MCQSMGKIVSSCDNCVARRGAGHFYFAGKPCQSVRNAFAGGLFDPDAIASVMVHGGANVPTVGCVGGPSSAN
jgi:hypothetical protein